MSTYVGMDELVDVMGESAALRLLCARGGTRFYVPRALRDDHWLVETVGESAARALVDHVATGLGGSEIELPRGPSGRDAEMRARLDAAIESGRTEVDIARELGIHGRTVRRARQRQRLQGDSRQLKLF